MVTHLRHFITYYSSKTLCISLDRLLSSTATSSGACICCWFWCAKWSTRTVVPECRRLWPNYRTCSYRPWSEPHGSISLQNRSPRKSPTAWRTSLPSIPASKFPHPWDRVIIKRQLRGQLLSPKRTPQKSLSYCQPLRPRRWSRPSSCCSWKISSILHKNQLFHCRRQTGWQQRQTHKCRRLN